MTTRIKRPSSRHKREAENALMRIADQLQLMEQKILTVSDGAENSYQLHLHSQSYW